MALHAQICICKLLSLQILSLSQNLQSAALLVPKWSTEEVPTYMLVCQDLLESMEVPLCISIHTLSCRV